MIALSDAPATRWWAVIALTCTLTVAPAHAQRLAPATPRSDAPQRPLRDVLTTLNQKRGLYFLFDQQRVGNQRVSVPADLRAPIGPLLTQLLQGTGLSYRQVGLCYLIEARDGPAGLLPTYATNAGASAPTTLPTAFARQRVTISGFVREQGSRESLVGATVLAVGRGGTSTNNYGFFALSLPADEPIELIVSMVGYGRVFKQLTPGQSRSLDVELPASQTLDEVVLTSSASEGPLGSALTGQIDLPMPLLRETPALAGERDVLRTLQQLPGVQRAVDGQTGLHVRGGGADQNLLILDEAPVYNANHLFGFFSAFNVDALKSVRLQKGGFSARYGGRLSSVVEMTLREGNKERLAGEAGIGLVASRLTLEGPLTRRKQGPGSASFLLTARRTNPGQLLGGFVAKLLEDYTGTAWRANFYDLNAKANVELGRRDRLYLSGYFGRNHFGGGDSIAGRPLRWENVIRWRNATGTLRWNHLFNERLFANASVLVSNYDFDAHTKYVSTQPETRDQLTNLWRYFNGLTDLTAKYDLEYFPRASHAVQVGVATTLRTFQLNGYQVRDLSGLANRDGGQRTASTETALYAEDLWTVDNRLKLSLGGRATYYQVHSRPVVRFEPRLGASYQLRPTTSLRASYAEMNQFVHLLSNTGLGLPTDLWVPATAAVPPQHARQTTLALVHDLSPTYQLSVEVYDKRMQHIISYRAGADFIGLTNAQEADDIRWERNVTSGKGHASGLELTAQKRSGRLTGWLGYTWSITRWRFSELNNGQPFFPRHDRRHALALVALYELRPNLKLSAAWTYGSGNLVAMPVSGVGSFGHLGLGKTDTRDTPSERIFGTEGPLVQVRTSFNSFRSEDYHRLDLTAQWSLTTGRFTHRIEAGVVNAYGRRNPFYYDLHLNPDGRLVLKRVSLFSFLPSVNYAIRF